MLELKPLKISAKNLGYTALENFCPRCYWLKLKMSHRLPWASFPGVFSSIDAYTKHCIHSIIDNRLQPYWMKQIGDIVGYEKIGHWSKNMYEDKKTGITLSGMPDDIFVKNDKSRAVIDWKTAIYSKNQDALMPIYEIQINVYSILFGNPETDLYLVYMEPQSSRESVVGNITELGFSMCFNAKVVPIANDRSKVRKALTITKEIFQMDTPPKSKVGCKECSMLDKIIGLVK